MTEHHPAHLSVEDISVRFGGVHALNGVTFSAEPGAIVGLIGANGSGKTTTLDVLSGLSRRADVVRVGLVADAALVSPRKTRGLHT